MQTYTSDTARLVKNSKDNDMQKKDFFLGKRISIIAKDAGAANLICHYFKNKEKVIVFSQEPATKTFVEFGFKISNCIKEIIDFGDLFIVGTGTSNFEKQIVFEYLLNRKRWIPVFDHWINFEKRLKFEGLSLTPNEIIVFDKYAYNIAAAIFKKAEITELKNEYFSFVKSKVERESVPQSAKNFLYFHEPYEHIFEGQPYWKVCFEKFYQRISFVKSQPFTITFRPHPKSNSNYFKQYLKRFKNVTVSENKIYKDISRCDAAFGIRSAALYLTDQVGKQVFSTNIDPSFPTFGPLKKMQHIDEFDF